MSQRTRGRDETGGRRMKRGERVLEVEVEEEGRKINIDTHPD
jgi:hypothetical protein